MSCYKLSVGRTSQPTSVTLTSQPVHMVGVSRMGASPTLLKERKSLAPSLTFKDENLHPAVSVSVVPQITISFEEVCFNFDESQAQRSGWNNDASWNNDEPWKS